MFRSGRGLRPRNPMLRDARRGPSRHPSTEAMPLLTLDGLHLHFGGVAALSGVSLSVEPGEFFAIIGPNGAGKTSIFNCISGIYRPTRVRILFDGGDITPLKPHRRAMLRIARTFQNIALF